MEAAPPLGATGLAETAGGGTVGLEGPPALGDEAPFAVGCGVCPPEREGSSEAGAAASGDGMIPDVAAFGVAADDEEAAGLPTANAFWPGFGASAD